MTADTAHRELIADALYCDICADYGHVSDDHGEPLVIRDTGQRTVTESVGVCMEDAAGLIEATADNRPALLSLAALIATWSHAADDERDEYAADYLDDIDAILSDAGYHPVTNADQGSWLVYGPVDN